MAIDIVRAIPSDASSIVPVGLRAFEADRLNQELELRHLRDLTPTQQNEHLQWRIKRNERRMTGADKYWFKAVDSETGNPVGYTGMVPAKKESPETTTAASINDIFTEVPATIDLELYAVLERTLEEVKKRHMGDRDDFWCKCALLVLIGILSDSLLQSSPPWLYFRSIKARASPSAFYSKRPSSQMPWDKTFTWNQRRVQSDCTRVLGSKYWKNSLSEIRFQ